ncbi:HD-GYP domain-containing protein [Caballeronia zhejiangensis]|uniref:HD-GYP domain-containing protein n=1 Tax=Caballeronia zhejiangensis TaxID=871203 RepID=UPI00158C9DE2|nr:HD domain-containing phosphohydrolase [Caballeronia zhejiangensis]
MLSSQIDENVQELVLRLLVSTHASDEDTGIHMFRVGALAGMLALVSGCTNEFATSCFWAAPLHDVGKIGIPDAVLKKPGALNDNERRIMQSHALIGARILGGSGHHALHLASQAAAAHHERFDGTGYPLALSGEAIPLIGRIVAIADCYDALRMDRVYRKAWPTSAAVAFISENAGTHFDPVLARFFIERVKLAEAMIAEINQFPESQELSFKNACMLGAFAYSSLQRCMNESEAIELEPQALSS